MIRSNLESVSSFLACRMTEQPQFDDEGYQTNQFRKEYVGGEESHRVHWAAYEGDLKTLIEWLDKGFDVNQSQQSYSEYTALHLAVNQCREDCVKELIKRKANLELGDPFTQTPLMLAAQKGHLGILMLLIESKADVDHKDRDDRT